MIPTSQTYTGDGVTLDYAIPFAYVRPTDVVVTYVETKVAVPFTFLNTGVIRLASPPALGVKFKVARVTPIDTPEVVFHNASTSTGKQVNTEVTQLLNSLQEDRNRIGYIEDNAFLLNEAGEWDAKGHRIIHVGDAVDAEDAMNRQSVVAMVAAGPFAEFADDAETVALVEGKIMDPKHTALLIEAIGHAGVTVEADYAVGTNVALPNPNVSISTGNFIADGQVVVTGKRILLLGQTLAAQNGLWVYDQPTNTLTRPADYYTGMGLVVPFSVYITDGDSGGIYIDTTWGIRSPLVVTVDTDATIWTDALGNGVQYSNTFVAGHYSPTARARPSTIRPLETTDQPRYTVDYDADAFPQSIYTNLNNFGYVSRFIQQSTPFANRTAINNCINRHNVIIFDVPVYLSSQITAPISGKRFVFLGSGSGGPHKVFMDSTTASFMDLTGTHDVAFEDDLIIEYLARGTAGLKAIKSSTGFSRFKADRIFTKGVDFAFSVTGTIDGIDIDRIGVASLSTDNPLNISSTSAPGGASFRVGRVDGIPAYAIDTTSVNWTFTPFANSPVTSLNATLAANRTLTLSLVNAIEGYKARFLHNGGGGFTWSIGGLKTISIGQQAEVMVSNGAWVLLA
jgi:hypothetical protein